MLQYPETNPAPCLNSTNQLRSEAKRLLEKCNKIISASIPANDSLAKGCLGLTQYYQAKQKISHDLEDSYRARLVLKGVLDRLNSGRSGLLNPSYSQGLSGLGCILNNANKEQIIDFSMELEFAIVDTYLFENGLKLIRQNKNDYLHGAFGIIFYFLSRQGTKLTDQYAAELITEIFRSLNAKQHPCFIKNYFTHNDPDRYNLSLSHGQAGFILILIRALYLQNEVPGLKDQIAYGAESLLNHMQIAPASNSSLFPHEIHLNKSETSQSNRLGWCYGDLNHALVLYEAYQVTGVTYFRDNADRIGLSTTKRTSIPDTLCINSHFCHGSSGLAQCYRRLYRLGALPDYEAAYLFWINRTIDLLKVDLEKGFYKDKATAFLEGLLGPVMVLLSFISDDELDWPKSWLL